MEMRFEEVAESDVERLAMWMSREIWPFHARAHIDASWFLANSAESFFGPNSNSFWVIAPDSEPVGVVRVFDVVDVTPLIDLRVAGVARGRGIGTVALGWITRFVFETYPDTQRLGGYTRYDNLAMRRVFDKCGFIQEAYHRMSWRVEGSALVDSVGYAVLRRDWSTGTTTPVLWP